MQRRSRCSRHAPDGASVFSQGSGRRESHARSPWYVVRYQMEPWKGDRNLAAQPDGSFPKIACIEFDFVFREQRKELILIGLGIMVLRLIGDVASYTRQM